MRLPRDMSGDDLGALLRRRYGYRLVRQRGSHMRLIRTAGGITHSVTVPRHHMIRVGTLSGIVSDVAEHLGKTPVEVRVDLFGS